MGRTLREYEHVAERGHVCGVCQTSIRPGDLYRGVVFVNRLNKISVWKEHVFPSCPDEYFRREEEFMDECEARAENGIGLRIAA